MSSRKTKWLAEGAPEQVTDFLDAAVGEMHQKAVENNTLHKEGNEDADSVAAGIASIVDVEPAVAKDVSDDVEDVVVEPVADEVESEQDDDSVEPVAAADDEDGNAIVKAYEDMLTASFKAYHEEVAAPLLERIDALEALVKELTSAPAGDALDTFAYLPPAHAASAIRKAFGKDTVDNATDEGNHEATEKELSEVVDDVADEDGDIVADNPAVSSNLLAEF